MIIKVSKEDKDYINECLESGEVLREDLRRWFKEKWVDVSKKVNGKYPPCGRKDADGKAYPKCRPSKKISKETPKIASSYSKKEKKAMTLQKRRAEKKEPKIGKGNKPTITRFDENNKKLNENNMKFIITKQQLENLKLKNNIIENNEYNTNYMFFSNLEQIRRQCDLLLKTDKNIIENLLNNGHDWADDHISSAKENVDQVFDFIMNKIK